MLLRFIKVLRNLTYKKKIISKSIYYQYTCINHITYLLHQLYEKSTNQEHHHKRM